MINREKIKLLIMLAKDVDEADEVINTNYHFKTIAEKVAFIRGMFGVEVLGHEQEEPDDQTYYGMLCAIINEKYIL